MAAHKAIKIAPSLLAADLAKAGEEIRLVREAGADLLHLDVADGHFAPNLTFGPAILRSISKACDVPWGVHLMVTNPEQFIEPFITAGANELFFHIELDIDHAALARRIRDLGARPGLAVTTDTPAEALADLTNNIDLILVMTVPCGYSGQPFNPDPVQKIPTLRALFGDNADITVDGGVSIENAGMLVSAGANVLVAGHSIFDADDRAAAIRKLRAAAEAAQPSD